jgi:hemoglobin
MPVFSLASKAGAALVLAVALLAAPARAGTLYDDLGGRAGLTRIVDGTLHRALLDPRVKEKLDDANIERLQGLFVLQFCMLTGGPCRYPGRSMKAAHADLNLTPRHFNALVEDLQDAMDAEGVPFRTQNRLLALLAPMHRDIVATRSAATPGAAP